ncbi:uncharacterized protein ISCGN_018329 [Ixodes scapularis]
MCKHIHAVAYLGIHVTTVEEADTEPGVEMPSTTLEATGFTLDDEPQSLLDDIRQGIEVGMEKTQPNSEDNICLTISGLNKSLSRKKLTSSSSSLVLKYRTKAQEVLDSVPDETSPKPRVIPHNKKMEKQPRYFPPQKTPWFWSHAWQTSHQLGAAAHHAGPCSQVSSYRRSSIRSAPCGCSEHVCAGPQGA